LSVPSYCSSDRASPRLVEAKKKEEVADYECAFHVGRSLRDNEIAK